MSSIKELYIPFMGFKTYVRIVGEEYKNKLPLILLHGGPGSTHNSFELLDELSDKDKRCLIMYDQLGCGNSYVEGHAELWKAETWVNELDNLIEYLDLKEFHLLGHSWGGMLEIIYMNQGKHTKRVKTITLSSTLVSSKLWEDEAYKLINKLPNIYKNSIYKCLRENDFESPLYKKVMNYYYYSYVRPKYDNNTPECLLRKKPDASLVYNTTWGPCEYKPTGNLKDYDYIDRLINIKVPVYICSGEKDESTPLQNKVMKDNLPNCIKQVIFKDSRHMTYFECHDEYIKELIDFLNTNK